MSSDKFSAGCAWINGSFVPIAEAAIPITDTGFTRSDATYDVVAVWSGAFFRLDDHLERFERSWSALRMIPRLSRAAMRDILYECVRRTGLRDAYVEMILTRGVPVAGDRDPRNFENRFYAFAIPYVWIATPEQQRRGIDIVVAKSVERIPSRCLDPRVKNFHWGDLVAGLFEAYEQNAHTAVLLDAHGNVTEGPGFNIFIVEAGRLVTPPHGMLEGITRSTVIELAKRNAIDCEESVIDVARLRDAEEVFLTSTAGGVMPVTTLDGVAIGNGQPGELSCFIQDRYWDAHSDPVWTVPVAYPDDLEAVS